MSTATINVRLDKATKDDITAFADKLGMPVSVLIVASLKQMLRTGRVEFSADLEPTDDLKAIIREAKADREAGRNTIRTDNIDDALAHLDSLAR